MRDSRAPHVGFTCGDFGTGRATSVVSGPLARRRGLFFGSNTRFVPDRNFARYLPRTPFPNLEKLYSGRKSSGRRGFSLLFFISVLSHICRGDVLLQAGFLSI